jgi:predicted fused transcriptional regulator/phosphomethylpyrimidine kinase
MKEIQQLLEQLEPAEALAKLIPAVKKNLAHLDEEARIRFVTDMIGDGGQDKIASMVNL